MSESDQIRLLGSSEDAGHDVEAQASEPVLINGGGGGGGGSGKGFRDFLRLSGHRHSFKRIDKDGDRERDKRDRNHDNHSSHSHLDLHVDDSSGDVLGDSAPPEWALLLIGCLLGLATGLFVAAFNKGVCQFFIFRNIFSVAWCNRFQVVLIAGCYLLLTLFFF